MSPITKLPSLRSMLALSAMVFLIADVQGGVGPFLSVYLGSTLKWNSEKIGLALGTLNIITVICQVPSGLLIDNVHYKRLLIALSTCLIAFACWLITLYPTFWLILFAQAGIGIAASIIPPATSAITLGLVGRPFFPKRISINGTFNHAGNVFTAMMTGITAHILGITWILYIVVIFCLASLVPLFFINKKEIDHNIARELPELNSLQKGDKPIALLDIITNPPILIFCLAVGLFQCANAAQLPLLGQELARLNPSRASFFMASSIVLAQVVMILVAYSLGFLFEKWGRKPIFQFAFLMLIIRAILYVLTDNPYLLLSIQILDGIAAGIFGVLSIIIIADLAKDSGRFNFTQGIVAVFVGTGAGLSNFLGGFIANRFGIHFGLLVLAAVASVGLLVFTSFMPETKGMTNLKKDLYT